MHKLIDISFPPWIYTVFSIALFFNERIVRQAFNFFAIGRRVNYEMSLKALAEKETPVTMLPSNGSKGLGGRAFLNPNARYRYAPLWWLIRKA